LASVDLAAYERDGFVRLEGFADPAVCVTMLARAAELTQHAAAGEDIRPAFVMAEEQGDFAGKDAPPEQLASKIFRLARDTIFHAFATSGDVVDLVEPILGTGDIDCFLSQFIFKNPGAWGQPWHQDSFYFPFEPARPIVGAWLAVTEATLQNGCLHVLPASHREPVHTHVEDQRPNANYGYTEIVDHDTSDSVPVLMDAGDLLLFDSHLMHRSTDNLSEGIRAAMVYHYARAGSVDHTEEIRGYTVNDWMSVRRSS
jgi:ectoine hydroxylase-related dioxygenase (phytanoyl-CoA dioxygenase family)